MEYLKKKAGKMHFWPPNFLLLAILTGQSWCGYIFI